MNVIEARYDVEKALVFAIQKTLHEETQKLGVALPRGWRLITEILEGDFSAPYELLHLDLRADRGGGSWAEAKIQTLRKFPEWTATHPMEIEELKTALERLSFTDYDQTVEKAKLYAELTPEQIKWLVDVENGPGLAPGFGGIKIPYSGYFIHKTGSIEPQEGNILIAFSGAAQWQDLYFALKIAQTIKTFYDRIEDEFLAMNFGTLKKDWPEIAFWLDLLGLD